MTRFATLGAVASLAVSAACGGGGEVAFPVVETPAVREIRIVDADTVDIDGTRYRLLGIDAPERHQTCRTWGRTWDCGAAATEALMSRVDGMSCKGSGTDAFGRTIGVCSAGGEDLNAWLVANGWALAYRRFSEDYVGREEQARSGKRGIHRGEFIDPWDWRRGERLQGEDTFSWIASAMLDVGELADSMLRGDDVNMLSDLLDDSVFGIVDDTVAVSFGAAPGTNPVEIGGGVWRGAVLAMDTEFNERLEGDAVIEIDDFAHPDVDVALTGIAVAGGRPRADIRWENIPVVQGAFRARDTTGLLEGHFYGSSHREVGGIFEGDGIVGAFGASR